MPSNEACQILWFRSNLKVEMCKKWDLMENTGGLQLIAFLFQGEMDNTYTHAYAYEHKHSDPFK